MKRAVSLSIDEELIAEASHFTSDLSAALEGLLQNFVREQRLRGADEQRAIDQDCEALNEFHAKHGSFADEHSTL